MNIMINILLLLKKILRKQRRNKLIIHTYSKIVKHVKQMDKINRRCQPRQHWIVKSINFGDNLMYSSGIPSNSWLF